MTIRAKKHPISYARLSKTERRRINGVLLSVLGEKRWRLIDLAGKSGIDYQYITRRFREECDWTASDIIILAKTLNLTGEHILKMYGIKA